jgi:tripartite-type tricarboxylate transporter receptor subunit TctC
MKSPIMVAVREKAGFEDFVVCGDAMAKFQATEFERWGKVIKAAGIEAQ